MLDVKFGLRVPSFPVDGSSWEKFIHHVHSFIGELEPYFDSAWVCDHFVPWLDSVDRHAPTLEGFTSVAYLSAIYRRLKWGNIVLCNSYRKPALLAKMCSTLQNLSNGRFILGIGAGWKIDEYISYGYEFPPAAVRIGQLEEAVQIIRMMWRKGRAAFKGKYYRVEDAVCEPKPDPIPPIMIGGGGEKLLLKVVAKHADWWNIPNVSVETYRRKLNVLKKHCEAVGRDFNEIVKTLATIVEVAEDSGEALRVAMENPLTAGRSLENYIIGNPEKVAETIREYVKLGVSYFIIRFLDFPSTRGAKLFIREVASKLV